MYKDKFELIDKYKDTHYTAINIQIVKFVDICIDSYLIIYIQVGRYMNIFKYVKDINLL